MFTTIIQRQLNCAPHPPNLFLWLVHIFMCGVPWDMKNCFRNFFTQKKKALEECQIHRALLIHGSPSNLITAAYLHVGHQLSVTALL
jgi:hypothetical protein